MHKQLMKFIGLSWLEKRMFLEAFCLTGVVRLAVLALPFRRLAPFLGQHMRESPLEETIINLKTAGRIGRVIETVSRHTVWESKCLVQAIVGKIMLRRRGIANTLYLGIGTDEDKNLLAHAWLRCGGKILTGGRGVDHFTIVGKFADNEGQTKSRLRR